MKYFLSILLFLPMFIGAQEIKKCATDEVNEAIFKANPELREAYHKLQEQYRTGDFGDLMSITDKYGEEEGDTIYVIPVVFHVLHEYGSENISDEQIYREMDILNQRYRKLNFDTVDIIPEFKKIAADTRIEFKLATIDPLGNPTNGIVRHFTHETNIGDMGSKIDQWPRGRYLNIWVARTLKYNNNAAAYAIKPIGTEGGNAFMDGVMTRPQYVSDIGTSNYYNSKTLTHEIGHYLALSHVWGDNNDAGVKCGDDGIPDTPRTRGFTPGNCPLNFPSNYPGNAIVCNSYGSIIENFQNYMDYSYCDIMFTEGQAKYMRTTLGLEVGSRVTLWSKENLENSVPNGVVFNPVADFFTQNNSIVGYVGTPVNFKNWSWRLTTDSPEYTWEFEDGAVATSNDINPTVSFTSPGWKDVTLTVTDHGRTHTITKKNFIYIVQNWPEQVGEINFDFERSDESKYWIIENPKGYPFQWEYRSDAGRNGSGGMFLDMTNPYTNPLPYSPEFFFNIRREAAKSGFFSRPVNASLYSDATLSLDVACGTEATSAEDMLEQIEIYVSPDGGLNWHIKELKKGIHLVNNGTGWDYFYPSISTEWTTFEIPLSNIELTNKFMVRVVYTASDYSNNIAIDNIKLSGVLSVDAETSANKISVYPNPTSANEGWNIAYDNTVWGGAQVKLFDVAGREISQMELSTAQTSANINVDGSATSGVYVMKIIKGDLVTQKKLVLK